jgi:two-component system, chemotaxis family, protein-glutamate methylesterase/glutaminase
MMKKTKRKNATAPVTVLVIDDSQAFRILLRDIFNNHPRISIVGEAANGIQGLDLLIKLNPDVILMDMEMPLMDGMTALQHLMIHTPTPTIMFSSLTKNGTARSFDTLKNGAVDFVCKDIFFQGQLLDALKESIINKVLNASGVYVKSIEPVFPGTNMFPQSPANIQKVVFCEECGCREVVNLTNSMEINEIKCSQCGDRIELNSINKYRRNNFITFIGAGEGGFSNLLNIIPKIHAEISGSLIVQIYADFDHVVAFTEYLDSVSNMKVIRSQDGLIIEGGNCYVASCNENISLKPYSAHYTLRCKEKNFSGITPLDAAMCSISAIFKDHAAAFILSGNEIDGEIGVSAIQKNNGSVYVLDTKTCFCKRMGENIMKKCHPEVIPDESDIVMKIESLHLKAKETVLTA